MASVVLQHGFDRDFSRYLREIDAFSMFAAETEFGPAPRSPDIRSTNAAHGFVTSRLRLVTNIAAGSRGHGRRSAGLIADRNMGPVHMGPVQADGRSDPDRGFRFAARAMRWIRTAAGHGLACPIDARRS
jgi:DNA-directed RNA polymerase sigma subunit (sigma70/sigma32)